MDARPAEIAHIQAVANGAGWVEISMATAVDESWRPRVHMAAGRAYITQITYAGCDGFVGLSRNDGIQIADCEIAKSGVCSQRARLGRFRCLWINFRGGWWRILWFLLIRHY